MQSEESWEELLRVAVSISSRRCEVSPLSCDLTRFNFLSDSLREVEGEA